MRDFRDPVTGRWHTRSIFWEMRVEGHEPVYTLKDREHEGLPSLKNIYLENCQAPEVGEYDFANEFLGGWKHWTVLCACKWFEPHIDEWREELEVKLRSQALKEIILHSKSDKGYQAAKYLADRGWSSRKAGAPSKEEKQRQNRLATRIHDEIDDDINRILN